MRRRGWVVLGVGIALAVSLGGYLALRSTPAEGDLSARVSLSGPVCARSANRSECATLAAIGKLVIVSPHGHRTVVDLQPRITHIDMRTAPGEYGMYFVLGDTPQFIWPDFNTTNGVFEIKRGRLTDLGLVQPSPSMEVMGD